MPTRTQLLAATPRCQQKRILKQGQHGTHYTCDTPLKYSQDELKWICPACGLKVIRATPNPTQNQNATA